MAEQRITRLSEPVNDRDHVRGPSSAQVSLVEYGDFECPYCRAAAPIVTALIEALGDDLSVTFRHFPLTELHPHAQHAAEVAEASASQGKFWEMHDALFTHQDALDDESLLAYAKQLELDEVGIKRDLASHGYAPLVVEDIESGLESGVNGTPTFYINGIRYDGPVALRDMMTAIREIIPGVQASPTAASSIRIPRVKWPGRVGAADA